jgi:ADP-heptose:LPS heptosyltransferase
MRFETNKTNMFPEADRDLGGFPDITELEHLALCGETELLHDLFRKIPEDDREDFAGKYILHSVVRGGILKLCRSRTISTEKEVSAEISFLNKITMLFLFHCRQTENFPREIFETLLEWSEQLQSFAEFDVAQQYQQIAIEAGIHRHPDLWIRLIIGKAALLEKLGKFEDVASLLGPLMEHHYLIPDRNLLPQILMKLAKAKLQLGEVDSYKNILICGLRKFYSNLDERRMFMDQLRKSHRNWREVLTQSKISLQDRVIIFLHILYFYSSRKRVLRLFQIPGLLKLWLIGSLYLLNYARNDRIHSSQPGDAKKNILITRAMGGIGDFLMMTPGFHRLKRKYPEEDLVLAIPRRFVPIFEGNSDVRLVDIEDPDLRSSDFSKWFNLSDCPAARVESRTAPKVRKSRIDIFARALGLSRVEIRNMDKHPRYFLKEEDERFREEYWEANGLQGRTVIGIQLESAELYRNYPYMPDLVREIARDHVVLLFDSEAISSFSQENIVRVEGLPLRKAFAIASGCDAIVAPDSAFVHFAAALDIPTVALYGPIDGHVRTKEYPRCLFLDASAKLECIPCWRNEAIPCRVTNMRNSICMFHISVQAIQDALQHVLRIYGARA